MFKDKDKPKHMTEEDEQLYDELCEEFDIVMKRVEYFGTELAECHQNLKGIAVDMDALIRKYKPDYQREKDGIWKV